MRQTITERIGKANMSEYTLLHGYRDSSLVCYYLYWKASKSCVKIHNRQRGMLAARIMLSIYPFTPFNHQSLQSI